MINKRKILKGITIVLLVMVFILFLKNIGGSNLEDKNIKEINNKPIKVLMYHHFDKEQISGTTCNPDEFVKQLDYLQKNKYNTITISDLYNIKQGKQRMPKNPIIITADDGYFSNYEVMYKELKNRNMKATIFPIANRVANECPGIKKINVDQLKEMHQSGVIDFQLHTFDSHNIVINDEGKSMGDFSTNITGESKEDYKKRIDNDIKQNIAFIENNLGYKPVALAYPFGHFSDVSKEVLKENGIELGLTIKDGEVNIYEDNTLELNRINISGEYDINEFIQILNTEY